MRAVERAPWAERRSSRHDEMCALVAANAQRLFTGGHWETDAVVEAPCGRGFCDVYARTVAPPGDVQAAVVEVKTRDERASAGDIIRQLKWYRQNLSPRQLDGIPGRSLEDRRRAVSLVLVVENVLERPEPMLSLLAHERVEVLPIAYFEETTE